VPEEAGYFAADAEATEELGRLRLIEKEQDPQTFRCLEAINACRGWRCLDVGAGAGSVARWLSRQVSPQGWVVAVDVDLTFLDDVGDPNIEMRLCDITRDDIEPAYYDLVHSRNLLMHMTNPAEVLERMVATLRPGGWLLAEEPDFAIAEPVDPTHPMAEMFDSCWRKWINFLAAAGIFNPRFGKILPSSMESAGLVEMGNYGSTRVVRGGEPYSRLWIQTWQRTNAAIIAKGVLTESEVVGMRRVFMDPTFTYRTMLLQSVWGRKPPQT
jgi:SAM-dependent methyltransferase